MPLIRRFGLDALLVLGAAAVALSVLASHDEHRIAVAGGSAGALVVFCARRLSALAATVGSFGLVAVGMTLEPHATVLQFVAMLLSFALAGAVNRGRELVVAAVCGVALLAEATLVIPTGAGVGDFALSSVIALGFLAAGWQVTRRGHLLAEARDSAAAAAATQQERTRQALAEERARIARELHDVVSHGLSVVVVQTQAARGAVDDLPDGTIDQQVARRLDAVEATAREALGEMRRMLGLLQLDDLEESTGPMSSPEPEPPSPGLVDLAGLVDRAREAGCEVAADLPDRADPTVAGAEAGAGVQLAAYRIVQESLTNVLKHAPGASVSVRVAAERDRVEVRVRSTMTGAGAAAPTAGGHGLVGMRERATTYGGHCVAGPTPDGLFEVHAVLPLERQHQEARP